MNRSPSRSTTLVLLFVVLLFGDISSSSNGGVHALPFSRAGGAVNVSPPSTTTKKSGGYDKFLTKLFKNADISGDGKIDLTECYTLVLQLYVRLNRQAPIPPPSREKILRLYRENDTSGDGRISLDEFKGLANVLLTRALTRLVAFKMMTLICAPILAEYLVRRFVVGKDWWPRFITNTVTAFQKNEEKSAPMIESLSSPHFVRTILIVLLMLSLGKVVMAIVNFVLDMVTLYSDESNESEQKQRVYRDLSW